MDQPTLERAFAQQTEIPAVRTVTLALGVTDGSAALSVEPNTFPCTRCRALAQNFRRCTLMQMLPRDVEPPRPVGVEFGSILTSLAGAGRLVCAAVAVIILVVGLLRRPGWITLLLVVLGAGIGGFILPTVAPAVLPSIPADGWIGEPPGQRLHHVALAIGEYGLLLAAGLVFVIGLIRSVNAVPSQHPAQVNAGELAFGPLVASVGLLGIVLVAWL